MRWRVMRIGAAMILSVGSLHGAFGQTRTPPGGTTPGGAMFDRLRQSTTRPMPETPAPIVRQPDMSWVPDRFVQLPGVDGQVLVPGHWERRLSDHEVYAPPLIGRTPQGDTTIHFRAGTRPPVNERQFP